MISANSFKDKDRLTARDVAAAEKLVNLYFAKFYQIKLELETTKINCANFK